MGAYICGLRRSPSTEVHQFEEFVSGSQSSLAELLSNPPSSKNETRKKRVLQDSSDSTDNVIVNARKLTLEDCLTASPGRPKSDGVKGSGELYVFKHNSKRIFPEDQDTNSRKPQNNIDMVEMGTCLMEVCEENDNNNSTSLTKNAKRKKRVTFRFPQEADIYVVYSPKQELQGVQGSIHQSFPSSELDDHDAFNFQPAP